MAGRDQRSKNTADSINEKSRAYIVGGGIASLACAAFLIRDGGMPGKNIFVFEESDRLGGSLDGQGSPDKGYVIRGGRMFEEEAYTCTYNLLSSIPSLNNPKKSVREEMIDFNKKVKTNSKCRLVENGKKVDASKLGLSQKDKLDIVKLMLQPEESLGARRIEDCFAPSFFQSNFWFLWSTMFAFLPWHSAAECRRYLHRFIQEFPRIHTLSGVRRTPYNQYDSIVVPLAKWLQVQGVHFELDSQVLDLELKPAVDEKTVERIQYLSNGKKQEVTVTKDDYVFTTLGSMTAGSCLGTMNSAPCLKSKQESGGAWTLWETIAQDQPDFGHPAVFDSHIEQSKWLSFTITFRDPVFFRLMENLTGNKAGTGGLITFKDSNWLMSLVLAYQPHFLNQPSNIQVCWGDGLLPDKEGNYVRKRMSDCTGAEILTEICSHLRFNKELPRILETSTCIPCMMPFITSQFMPREMGDRPLVVPKGSTNLAFIGQFCEMPDDVVFTVEYSVRSAQTAVYSLLKVGKTVAPLYKGEEHISVLANAARTMLK